MVNHASRDEDVLPTRVGMVRKFLYHAYLLISSPHACGDGPRRQNPAELVLMFSPRVWGWSARRILSASMRVVTRPLIAGKACLRISEPSPSATGTPPT